MSLHPASLCCGNHLQGFDKGVFGGNFHTHNSLHTPPGVDVLCFSNGHDYVRGWRNAIRQAEAGRMVMLVDSTNLLNQRHLEEGSRDNAWLTHYPVVGAEGCEDLEFDDVILYGAIGDGGADDGPSMVPGRTVVTAKGDTSALAVEEEGSCCIVTYGNGVPTALLAQRELAESHGLHNVSVVDCPMLSGVPEGLRRALSGRFDRVVFADVCKEVGAPLASTACTMQNQGDLPAQWQCIGAPNTYNPLGRLHTFLSTDDIVTACKSIH